MALIKSPECGKEVSDKAKACPNCGCPIEDTSTDGLVRIKKPNDIVQGWANPVKGTVIPKRKYALAQDLGVHMFATFRLTEIDLINAD